MLSWLIFPCRLLHLSSSEIQLGCYTVKVNACGPIPASPLGGKGGERYPRMGEKDSSSKPGVEALSERGRSH